MHVLYLATIIVAIPLGYYLSRSTIAEKWSVKSLFSLLLLSSSPFIVYRLLVPECSYYYSINETFLWSVLSEVLRVLYTFINFLIPIMLIIGFSFLVSSGFKWMKYKPYKGHYDVSLSILLGIILFWLLNNLMATGCGLVESKIPLTLGLYWQDISGQIFELLVFMLPIISIYSLLLSSNSFKINHWLRRGLTLFVLLFWLVMMNIIWYATGFVIFTLLLWKVRKVGIVENGYRKEGTKS